MTKSIEKSPVVMIEEDDAEESKVVHLANMKKSAIGYFQLKDDSIVSFVDREPGFIVFEQSKLRYIRSDDDFKSIKDKLKSKLIILKNRKQLVFNKPKSSAKSKVLDLVKVNSNKKLEASGALKLALKIEDFDESCLSLIKINVSKNNKRTNVKPKKKPQKEESEDEESDKKTDEEDSTGEEDDSSSTDDDVESPRGEKSSDEEGKSDDEESDEDEDGSDIESVDTPDEDEEFSEEEEEIPRPKKKKIQGIKSAVSRSIDYSKDGSRILMDMSKMVRDLTKRAPDPVPQRPSSKENPKNNTNTPKNTKPKKK